jgi:hypothetical protein
MAEIAITLLWLLVITALTFGVIVLSIAFYKGIVAALKGEEKK